MERRGIQILAAGVDITRQFRGLDVTLVALALAKGLFVQVYQQHVFHRSALPFLDGCALSRLHSPPLILQVSRMANAAIDTAALVYLSSEYATGCESRH